MQRNCKIQLTNGKRLKTMSDLEKLGQEISRKCNWVGEDIFTVFQAALEDANYHTFNRLVGELWRENE